MIFLRWQLVPLIFFCLGGGLKAEESKHAERTISEWRKMTESFGKDIGKAASVSSSNRTIPARDGFPLACRIFNDSASFDGPVLIFYPGCAFVFDFFELNSVICSRIAEKAGIKVILVQFRLAPENPMPKSLHDSYDAFRYVASHSEEFGIDPGKIFIGGWCSGANAAAFVSKSAREDCEFAIYHQILLGGSFDLSHSFHEFDEYEARDETLNRKLVAHLAHAFYSLDSNKNPLFSPYWEPDFKRFPATTLLFGEYDALRNDSEAYFEKLKGANVSVEKILLKGQCHNTIVMQGLSPEGPDPSEVIATILRNKLSATFSPL